MSTYYQYRDVKVMIAHKLMCMEGWKVYGYKEDRSDSMTDYFDPANWDGVAEKNGYILCVDVYGASNGEEVRKYNYNGAVCDKSIREKIEKLQQMTVERGASEQEEASAKMMIAKLQQKAEENINKYVVVDYIPGHLAHPPRCNWHIEKDSVIVAKGNGILKYAQIDNYYSYPSYMEDMEKFKTMSKEDYIKDYAHDMMFRWNDSEERATEAAESHYKNLMEDSKLMKQFEDFINKINATCGGSLGEGESVVYEKVKVTEYKTELKPVETESGSLEEGQCFILKTDFMYGKRKGYVYRIHVTDYNGRKSYHAVKLNGKLTKECTGVSNESNHWYLVPDFEKWIKRGCISWCELQEVKTPYEVEKVVKKTVKSQNKAEKTTKATSTPTEPKKAEMGEINTNNYTFEVSEDTDTRDNSKIWLVKVKENLSREEYKQVNAYIKSLGGYYSRYKRAFLFKESPTEKLGLEKEPSKEEVIEAREEPITPTEEKVIVEPVVEAESTTEPTKKETEQPKEKTIHYTIEEDIHTKTNEKLWVVKLDERLSKEDFVKVKQKFAVLKGFFSGYKKGFIFKYDPMEKIQNIRSDSFCQEN